MSARILPFREPTSVATLKALVEDAISKGRLDDARRLDDERHAAQVRVWRLKAQRAARRLDEARGRRAAVRFLVAATEGDGAA